MPSVRLSRSIRTIMFPLAILGLIGIALLLLKPQSVQAIERASIAAWSLAAIGFSALTMLWTTRRALWRWGSAVLSIASLVMVVSYLFVDRSAIGTARAIALMGCACGAMSYIVAAAIDWRGGR